MVVSTAGDHLATDRAVSVRLLLDPEDVFTNLGLFALYDEVTDELARRENAADADVENGVLTEAGETELDAARVAVETMWRADLDA